MTDLIAELKSLKEKATPGPFIVSTCVSPEESKGEVTLDALRSGGMGEVVYRYKWIKNRADCDLDAALRNHLPTILAKLEEAERERDEARAALAKAREDLTGLELKFAERAEGQRQWISENAPYISHDQKHLDAYTVERAYWHYGYCIALGDVAGQIKATLAALTPTQESETP